MARGGGIALKSLSWVFRAIEFASAAVVLALFSYILAKLSTNDLPISSYWKAIEGISGVAVLYTIAAVLFVCCLGGLGFFALIAFILDIAFVGGFIFIAYETRDGASSCNGFVNTPLGAGFVDIGETYGSLPSLRTSCRINTAVFAVSIVAIVFFFFSALVEIALWRHHKSEKKYGPGPANNYTAGSGNRKFWQRKNKDTTMMAGGVSDKTNPDALPTHYTPNDVRNSYQTEATAVGAEPTPYNKYVAPHGTGVDTYQTTGVTGATEMPAARY